METNKNKICVNNIHFQRANFFNVEKKGLGVNKLVKFENKQLKLTNTLNLTVLDEDVFLAVLALCKTNYEILTYIKLDDNSTEIVKKYSKKIKTKISIYKLVKFLNKRLGKKNYEAVRFSIEKLANTILSCSFYDVKLKDKIKFTTQLIEVIFENDELYIVLNPFHTDLILNNENLFLLDLDNRFNLTNAYSKKLFTYFCTFGDIKKNGGRTFKKETILKYCLSLATSKDNLTFKEDDLIFKNLTKNKKDSCNREIKKAIMELKEKGLFNVTINNDSFFVTVD